MNAERESPQAVPVLIVDSSRMQAQLLVGALRRRSEFHVLTCEVDVAAILRTIAAESTRVVVFSLTRGASAAAHMAVLRAVHISSPKIAMVLLVETCDRDLAVSAFRAGVRGIFCISDNDFRLLCRCIQRVGKGEVWASAEQIRYLVDMVSEVPSLRVLDSRGRDILTPREEQVVALVAEGLSNRGIARELDLSEHTIKKYMFRIFEKLGISSRVELVLYAVNHGAPLPAQWLAGLNRAPSV